MSSTRRLERIKRLEELQQLEALLQKHKTKEAHSLMNVLKIHWSKHGPVLSAFLCGIASLTASFALWKMQYFHNKSKDELSMEAELVRVQQSDMERMNQIERENANRMIQKYLDGKLVVVSAPKGDTSSTSQGWLGYLRGPKSPPTTIDTTSSSPVNIVHHTYTASKSDLAKLTKLQTELEAQFK